MEIFQQITPLFVAIVACGVVIGIVFGAIPGMTATMAVAVCLPMTYGMDMTLGLGLLLGLYVGGISGGLVPAILLNIPGTPASITTTFDGYPMTQQGRGEIALKTSIVASLFGGMFSATVLYFFAPTLADIAIKFSYIEKFLIILFALSVIASLSKSLLMGAFSGVLGIWISLIGAYDISVGGNGETRLMLPFMEGYLENGFSLLPVLIGVFGLAAILEDAEKGLKSGLVDKSISLAGSSRFSIGVFRGQIANLIRSSGIGTFVGMLPGIGGSAASVLAYTQTKNFSKDPSKLGQGATEGVISSESANNGLTGGALIPLLSLGIPGDSTTAVLIAAFTLQGIQVGPLFIGENMGTWHTMVIALVIANIAMFFVMFFAIKHIVKVVLVPKHILYPIIVMMCVVGAYTINHGVMFDVWTLLLAGVFGWAARKVGIEIAPLIIGFILGKSAEVYFVKSLESFDDPLIFFTKSPIAVGLWVLIFASLVFSIYSSAKGRSRVK